MIPEASDSRTLICSKYSLADVEIALSSSNSSDTPEAITFPFTNCTGASSFNSFSIFLLTKSHGFSCEAKALRLLLPDFLQYSTTGTIAFNARFSCTTSRGQILAVATLEIKRSKSPICLI